MIKILEGTKETVDFEQDSLLMCYDNTDYEEYPLHWHTPIEIIMPEENSYDVDCNSINFHLREGDVLIIAPGALHHIGAMHGRRIIFQAGMSMISTYGDFDAFFSLIQPAIVITPEDYPSIHQRIAELMKEIKSEYFSGAPLSDAAVCGKLLEILVTVGRSFTSRPDRFTDIRPTKQTEYVEKFMEVCNYINAHCTEELSLDEMAEMAGFSKYHFSRLFKEFAGVTFYKYLNSRRITYAERLLLDPEINVMEAAARSGFNSLSAFMRMFKIIKGCTPTEFRNLYVL